MKLQGGGGCPAMFGELHSPGDTCMYIICTLQWNLDYQNLVYPNPNSSETTFYYEYYYNPQDDRSSLVALW